MVRDYMGPGRHFGEIGLMSALSDEVAARLDEPDRGRCTGTCTALDHVELVRIGKDAFLALLGLDPTIRTHLEQACLSLIAKTKRPGKRSGLGPATASANSRPKDCTKGRICW